MSGGKLGNLSNIWSIVVCITLYWVLSPLPWISFKTFSNETMLDRNACDGKVRPPLDKAEIHLDSVKFSSEGSKSFQSQMWILKSKLMSQIPSNVLEAFLWTVKSIIGKMCWFRSQRTNWKCSLWSKFLDGCRVLWMNSFNFCFVANTTLQKSIYWSSTDVASLFVYFFIIAEPTILQPCNISNVAISGLDFNK